MHKFQEETAVNRKKLSVMRGTKPAAGRAVLFAFSTVSELKIYFKLALSSALVLGCLLVISTAASARTLWVNDDDPNGGLYVPTGTSCNDPGYKTIQSAMNAAVAFDRINVCPGTYQEQVTIATAAKDNITLVSVTPLAAIIKATTVSTPAAAYDIVTIDGARNVTVRAFTITGPLPDTSFCNLFILTGVRVKGGGSANILLNHITEIRSTNPALRGCQNGIAIAVGRQFESQVGQANIIGNLIEKYQKGGIYVDNAGSSAQITGNVVRGEGPVNFIAQNGIQISREAAATILRNRISDNAYIVPIGLDMDTATGVLLYGATRATVNRNVLNRNQDGIDLFTMLAGNAIVSDNIVIGGLMAFPAELGTLDLGDGIFADTDTANNQLLRNFLRDNREHDCHDDSTGPNNPPAFVANIWRDNDGRTENKPGLCRRTGEGDDDEDDDGHDRDRGGHHGKPMDDDRD
jgi:hypothetical protein